MPVTLQIVGLYYSKELPISVAQGATITVKDVLDFAQANPQGDYSLSYGAAEGKGGTYVDFIMTTITGDFESPVSGTKYKAGQFSLKQSFTEIGKGNYTVWQYYIRDENKVPVRLNPPEQPYEQANVVKDGYTVIWRLVSICNAIPVTQTGLAASAASESAPRMNARLAKVVGMPAEKA